MNATEFSFTNSPLFDCLSSEDWSWLTARASELRMKKHGFIYFPKDKADAIFLLLSGRVKVSNYSEDGREIIKEIVYPGDTFGECYLAGATNYRNYATAMDETTEYLVVEREDLETLMGQNRQFAMEVFNCMGNKLREMERRLESLNFKPSRDRILDFIRDSILSKCKTQQDGTLVCPFLTHVDIAKMTDTSRQTVTLVLNELKRSDLINFDRNVLEIHDVAALCG